MEDSKKTQEEVVQTMDLDEAITFFENMKLLNNAEPHLPYINLGKVYWLKGMLRKAHSEFEQAQVLDPDNEDIRSLLESLQMSLN